MADIQNIKISKIEGEKESVKSTDGESVEKVSIPEKSFEKQGNGFDSRISEKIKIEKTEGELGLGNVSNVSIVQDESKRRVKEIEKVLEKDLDELYLAMSPEKREEFKLVGEETAKDINALLKKTTVKMKKIIELIRKWLLIIPGINKFFVEQEAKIKADEIIKINFLKKL